MYGDDIYAARHIFDCSDTHNYATLNGGVQGGPNLGPQQYTQANPTTGGANMIGSECMQIEFNGTLVTQNNYGTIVGSGAQPVMIDYNGQLVSITGQFVPAPNQAQANNCYGPINTYQIVNGGSNLFNPQGPFCPSDNGTGTGTGGKPCDDFNVATLQMQNACCGKCLQGVYSGTPGDACDTLTNSCKCCPDDLGGEERGCLDPNATNSGQCCPQNNYQGCVPTIQFDKCCEYDRYDPCKDPEYSGEECFICRMPGPLGCQSLAQLGMSVSSAMNNSYNIYNDVNLCNATEKCRPDDRGSEDPCIPVDGQMPSNWNEETECWYCKEPGSPTCSNAGPNAPFICASQTCYNLIADCHSQSECGPSSGEMIECQCCDGAFPQSMLQQVPANPGCSVLNGGSLYNCQPQQSAPISCKKPLPTNDFPVGIAESILRMQKLANIK